MEKSSSVWLLIPSMRIDSICTKYFHNVQSILASMSSRFPYLVSKKGT